MTSKDDQSEKIGDTDDDFEADHLLNSPTYMSAIMRRQVLVEMVKSLPKPVQDRVTALKNVQLEQLNLEAQFFEEVYKLEIKYQALYEPLYAKRTAIVTGKYEPTDEEKVWKHDDEEEEISSKMEEVSIQIRKKLNVKYPEDVKGVPDFWLTIFRCTELLSTMLQPPDEPVIKKLTDVTIKYAADQMSYVLEFHFNPNEYFTNSVLTKQYFLKVKVDPENPFQFEGPEIYKCSGCEINWNKDMNLTVKTIRKKQKHKARGAVRTITKQVPTDSFFNFFNPPVVEDDSKIDVETQQILGQDFEIGHFIRSRIIPKAALFYTGDIVDDDDDDYDDEEGEEEDEEEDEDESGGEGSPEGKMKKKANPAECQQQ